MRCVTTSLEGYNDRRDELTIRFNAMNPRAVELLANVLVSVAVVGLALVSWGDAAYAQGLHSGAHSGGASSFDVMGSIKHGIALAATVLLAGLALFAALV
jgi:hypothetical protein